MKKILFVISSLKGGGAERALSNITLHFPGDWEIDLLLNGEDLIDYPYRGNLLSLGINGKVKAYSLPFQARVLIKRIIRLRKLKKQNRYAACVSFLDSANVANILSGNRYCKTIVSVRASLVAKQRVPQYKYIVTPLVKLLYNRADHIVAVSREMEKELTDIFHLDKNKVTTIENGYDVCMLERLAEEEWNEKERAAFEGKRVLVNTGRLTAQKGQYHLIRAFAESVKIMPDMLLIILGSGELEAYLRQLAKECEIEDKVLFCGFVKNPYKYIARADAFVFPSLYEGFPNALAEAVCLGCPCIAADFKTGAREILAPELLGKDYPVRDVVFAGGGVLIPVCSGKLHRADQPLEEGERKLSEAMTLLLSDDKKMDDYRKAGLERKKSLGIEDIVRRWTRLAGSQTASCKKRDRWRRKE